jgi:hypothetical protein
VGAGPVDRVWGENPPYHHPVFVLTHHSREPFEMQRSAHLNRHPLTVEQMEVETLATEIQSGVRHRSGPPFV